MSIPNASICLSKVQVVLLHNLFTELECKIRTTTSENVKDPLKAMLIHLSPNKLDLLLLLH